ncbi:MAG: diguanylate cyclase, partial [Rhodanobacter sp.]
NVWNTMLAAALYTASTLTLAEGLLRRSEQTLGVRWQLVSTLLILVPIYYFLQQHPSLIARIYVLNFGLASVLLVVAAKLHRLRHGKPIDRLVWWTLLVFALHFFPRTLLTASMTTPSPTEVIGYSIFSLALQLALTLSSVALASVLLIAAPLDIIDSLREDRDHDMLTGLLNRRGFEWRAKAEIKHDSDAPLSLVVCDIDHFKAVNDTYGHSTGDRVLKEFAESLGRFLRSIDVVGRIGGEEFVALLPDCDAQDALFLIERLRLQLMQAHHADLPDSRAITASFGISERLPLESLWDWFARTDTALYAAKSGGRNRIFVHDGEAGVNDRTPSDSAPADEQVPAGRRTG